MFCFYICTIFYLLQSIVWHPNPSDYELCLVKGKSQVNAKGTCHGQCIIAKKVVH